MTDTIKRPPTLAELYASKKEAERIATDFHAACAALDEKGETHRDAAGTTEGFGGGENHGQ